MSDGLKVWHRGCPLHHLVNKLGPDDPLIDLHVHAIWALVRERAALLSDDISLATRLASKIDRLLDSDALSSASRIELEQVLFTVRACSATEV